MSVCAFVSAWVIVWMWLCAGFLGSHQRTENSYVSTNPHIFLERKTLHLKFCTPYVNVIEINIMFVPTVFKTTQAH